MVGERLAERGQGVRRGLGRHRPAVAKVVGVEARVQVVDVDPTARAGAAPSATARGEAATPATAVMMRTKGKRRKRGLRDDFGKDLGLFCKITGNRWTARVSDRTVWKRSR